MKLSHIFISFIIVLLLCSETSAFTVSYKQITSGGGMPGSQATVVKIKDDKVRMEMDSPQGKTITIVDGETIYSYIPSKNAAVEFKNRSSPDMEVLSDYPSYLESLNARVIGTERVGSYDCNIYEFVDPRTNLMSRVWLWKREKFPVKVETKVPDGVVTTIMENVKIGVEIDDSEFTLPPDVEIVDAQEFMGR